MNNTMFYKHRDNCRLCHSTEVEIVVPLQPIALKTPNLGTGAGLIDTQTLNDTLVPLDLYRCPNCGLLQLLDIIDPRVQYNDFRYKTSISLGLTDHFTAMARDLSTAFTLPQDSFVFEIGSNDGTTLRAFKALGYRVLGIDPARDTAQEATANGIETVADFFTAKTGQILAEQHGRADLIICNNTFANLDDLDDIIEGVKAIMAPDGVFVIETSYGADVVDSLLIDTVYHEHLSYFLVAPLDQWFTHHGLELIDAGRVTTKGGSLRLCVQFAGGPHARKPSVDAMIATENERGLDRAETYRNMSETLQHARTQLMDLVATTKASGGRIAAYGASVGTVTLLHQLGIATDLDFIADDKPLAERIEGPGYDIPICAPDRLYTDKPALVIILAVRYQDPIMAKHLAYLDEGGAFAVPLPELKVYRGGGHD